MYIIIHHRIYILFENYFTIVLQCLSFLHRKQKNGKTNKDIYKIVSIEYIEIRWTRIE